MKYVLSLLVLFILSLTVTADNYYNGYHNSDGYSFYNGYWYYGNVAYTRTRYYQPGYWSYGVYYPGYYYYHYYRYNAPQQNYTPPVTPKDTNWRTKLLQIAEYQVKENTEQRNFTEGIKALGLQNSLATTGNAGYSGYGYNVSVPVNASTQYGYSFQSIAQLYGDTNLNQIFQAAAQLTAGAQKLSGQATSDFQALVGQEGANRSRVAEILAKGQAAAQILNALKGPSSTNLQGFAFKVDSNGTIQKVDNGVAPLDKTVVAQQAAIIINTKCVSCHNPSNKKGGLDMTQYNSFSPEDKQVVWARITTDDQNKMMPRNPSGGPGQKLTSDELRILMAN